MLGIRDISDDGVLLAAGGFAVLMQLADPAVAAGVARHSDFADRPVDRLRGTLTFVYAVVYGTPAQQAAVRRTVNRAHGPVRGDGDDDGDVAYSAFDPDLQLWVAATLREGAMRMRALIYGPLDAVSAQNVQREYAMLGRALQVPEGAWPESVAEFDAYWSTTIAGLRVTPEARAVTRSLLRPRNAPVWLTLVMPLARLVTAGLLDPRLRSEFGFRWSPMQQRRFDRAVAVARVVWPRLPRSLRTLPKRYLLARLSTSTLDPVAH